MNKAEILNELLKTKEKLDIRYSLAFKHNRSETEKKRVKRYINMNKADIKLLTGEYDVEKYLRTKLRIQGSKFKPLMFMPTEFRSLKRALSREFR